MLDEGGELGKRLDFLLQELNREANTMLSKTSGASGENSLRITELGLEMKAEIERVSRAGSESRVKIYCSIVRLKKSGHFASDGRAWQEFFLLFRRRRGLGSRRW